jgi:hypothetical protein
MLAKLSSQPRPALAGQRVADAGASAGGGVPRAAALAGVVAVAADLAVYFVARAFWAVPGAYAASFNPRAIVATVVVGVVIAAVGLALLARLARRPLRIFVPGAVAVTLLSLGGPLQALAGAMPGFPAATTATGMTMIAMHLITGGVIAGLLPALARR